MTLDNGKDESRSSSAEICLQIIEISSDSEENEFCQPHPSKFVSALHGKNEHHESCSTWENDVIELTDSESNNSLDLPEMLSALVTRSKRKGFVSVKRQRSPSKKFIPLYADMSDDGDSDKDCILVLNDPPGSSRPIRSMPPVKGQDIANGNPLLNSPKNVFVPEYSRTPPNKKTRQSSHRTKEQARRQKYASELFAELNRDVFGDYLPKNTTLEWSQRLLTTAGRARWHRSREGTHATKIELASKILDCDERIRNTLSHEMCHLACWVIDNHPREGHGQLFKSWANKVMHRRPDIHISTRHNYEISYPYEWRCEKCSKIYGRHSKSIRPDECVCGACKAGKLIPLFIERRQMTPKVGRTAVTRPRDSPCLMVGSPTAKDSAVQQTFVRLTNLDEDILVNALENISINDPRD